MPLSPSTSGWQPTKILDFVRSIHSSTGVAVVVTDAGKGYLKGIGNPEGEHVLACEWVATNLARWFGLPTFEFGQIKVEEVNEIPLPDGSLVKPGPAFITRSELGESWSGTSRQLKQLVNVSDITRLVVFDTWTLNCDRFRPPPKRRCNYNNVFLSGEAEPGKLLLRAVDHTHCFTCGRELTSRLSDLDRIQDFTVYGCFPEFKELLQRDVARAATEMLRNFPHQVVVDAIQTIPHEWQVSASAKTALEELVVRRAAFVADHIMDWIWHHQRELEIMNGEEGEP